MVKKVVCLLMAFSMLFLLFGCNKKDKGNENAEATTEEITTEVSKIVETGKINPLTGLKLNNESAYGKRPVAITLNNHPSARPQWGYCAPDIVMEGVTEGGITRMLCFFADANDIPEKFGPVRSARHDFVEMAEGFDAIFVHWGGSTLGDAEISNHNVDDIDAMSESSCFFRDKTRNTSLEHRGCTKGSALRSTIEKKGYRTDIKSGYENPFKFYSEDTALNGGTCNSVKVVFSNSYVHTFKYDTSSNTYFNYMGSTAMTDADGKQMSVTNVIIIYTAVSQDTRTNNKLRDMDLSSGTGIYVSNGTYQEINWKKGNYNAPLKLYDKNGSELSLNKGKSWIGLVPTSEQSATVIS